MKPYGTQRETYHRCTWGKAGRRTYGFLAGGNLRYRRAARKRERRLGRERIVETTAEYMRGAT